MFSFFKAVIDFGDKKTRISLPGSLGDCIEYIGRKANVPRMPGTYVYKVSPRDKAAISGDALVRQPKRRQPVRPRPSTRQRSKGRRPSSKQRTSKSRQPKQGQSSKPSISNRALANFGNVMPGMISWNFKKDKPETSTNKG